MRVKKTAVHLVKKHETNCPFRIAKDKGIIVQFQDLGTKWGYYFIYKRIPIIIINSRLSKLIQRVVCAHELGHAIFHPKLNTSFMLKNTYFSVDKTEREANRFAAELLISDESIKDYLEQQMTIQDIALLHNVPTELVELKCKKLFL